MIPPHRILESSALYAGIGVVLVDHHTKGRPIGTTQVDLDIEESGGTFRELDRSVVRQARTPGGVIWFPWREHYRDAREKLPRTYRVRVKNDLYTPAYAYTSAGVTGWIAPYDDTNPPQAIPLPAVAPITIDLLPAATYPFEPRIPIVRGQVLFANGDKVRNARVFWAGAAGARDLVLTDADGEFSLPMPRAPHNTALPITAERPSGLFASDNVTLPADTYKFFTLQF